MAQQALADALVAHPHRRAVLRPGAQGYVHLPVQRGHPARRRELAGELINN